MLKKIAVSQLTVGMHLHAIEGAWIDHPFWKTKFVIRDDEVLRRMRESRVAEVWIDLSLGADVEPAQPAAPAALAEPPAARAPSPAPPQAAAPREATRTLREELQQAAAVCKTTRAAVFSMFQEVRMGKALDAEACMPLVEQVTSSVFRNPGALVSLARLKTKDEYTYMHSVAVCALMVALARQLGQSDDACRAAGLAGLLHDMGKALIPPAVLNKPDKLTDDEFAIVKTHPARGHQLLVEGKGAPPEALDVCLHHHERIDGKGYPQGLDDQALSLLARMGAVCDVYDAVTSNRPYKAGWDPAESVARMASWAGHFDPKVFNAFVLSLGIYPTGSLVRLESARLAIVVEPNPKAPVSPLVKVFYSTKSSMPIEPTLLDLARSNDRIVGRESPEKWKFPKLTELWAPPEVLQRAR
jgi:HD-GYP domain-containing protein (c-di-GMP phosphodiesterase class II)